MSKRDLSNLASSDLGILRTRIPNERDSRGDLVNRKTLEGRYTEVRSLEAGKTYGPYNPNAPLNAYVLRGNGRVIRGDKVNSYEPGLEFPIPEGVTHGFQADQETALFLSYGEQSQQPKSRMRKTEQMAALFDNTHFELVQIPQRDELFWVLSLDNLDSYPFLKTLDFPGFKRVESPIRSCDVFHSIKGSHSRLHRHLWNHSEVIPLRGEGEMIVNGKREPWVLGKPYFIHAGVNHGFTVGSNSVHITALSDKIYDPNKIDPKTGKMGLLDFEVAAENERYELSEKVRKIMREIQGD